MFEPQSLQQPQYMQQQFSQIPHISSYAPRTSAPVEPQGKGKEPERPNITSSYHNTP